ncbi:MAG: prepilin-type N-terminal cleavage/methylation domain-containing protein [Blastocatellia bacterium]
MLKINSKINEKIKTFNRLRGYSLIELIVALILGLIVIAGSVSIYAQIVKLHRRQQRVANIERALTDTQFALQQSLVTMTGRSITTYVDSLQTPALPGFGVVTNPKTGRPEPVRLGIVTPAKINGFDGFTILYADATVPRFTVGEPTTISGETGSAKIIASVTGKTNLLPGFGGSGGTGKGLDQLGSVTSNESDLANNRLPLPTDSPSPNPSPTSSSNPKGGIVLPGSSGPKAPNVPLNSTLTGLPFLATASMFNENDLYLMVGQATTGRVAIARPGSRLVRIISASDPGKSPFGGVGIFNQKAVHVTYDLCSNGQCSELLPNVINFFDSPKNVGVGGLLIKLKVASIYVKTDEFGTRLILNEGGLLVPSGLEENVSYQISGGTETILGEIDKFSVIYNLVDGSQQPTPNTSIIPWVSDISSIDITLERGMPGIPGTASGDFHRVVKLNYPLMIKNLN